MNNSDFLPSILDLIDEHPDYMAYKMTMRVGAPIILSIGVLGNIFSLVVLRSPMFRQVPSSVGFSLLALVDICILSITLLPRWLGAISDGKLSMAVLGQAGCKMDVFLTHFFAFLGSWTLVLITIERILAVVRPVVHGSICSTRNILFSWLAIAFVHFGVNLHFFWTQALLGNSTNQDALRDCITSPDHQAIWYVWPWVDFVLSFAAPFLIILVCNVTIVFFLCVNHRKYKSMIGVQESHLDKITSTTAMLVTVAIVHLLTTSPVVIVGLLLNYQLINPPNYNTIHLMINIVVLLFHLNSAVNFLLYFVSNALFRKAAKYMFCRCCSNTYGRVGGERTEESSWYSAQRTEISMEQYSNTDQKYTY